MPKLLWLLTVAGVTCIVAFTCLNIFSDNFPKLSGYWRFEFTEPQSPDGHPMTVTARQTGLNIVGHGRDEYGNFRIEGRIIPPNTIQLKKFYQHSKEKPVVLEGQLALDRNNPFYATGLWTHKYVVGGFLRNQVRQESGMWQADFLVDNEQSGNEVSPGEFAHFDWFEKLDLSTKLMIAAVSLIGASISLFYGSVLIFGPAGKLNRWANEKYVPSQFKAQHRKAMQELSQPLQAGGLPLGRRCEWKPWRPWEVKDLALTPEAREIDPHILILGSSNTGKTRLMAHMIANDIEANDRALVVIDSDGGLTDLVTSWIATHPNRKAISKRVRLLDPCHTNNTLGYNPLQMPENNDLQSAASAIVHGFKAIYKEPPGAQSQWNQQTANILRNAALLLMVNGRTLADLPALLNDNDFRDVLLQSIEKRKDERAEHITLLDTWGQYKRLARTEQWITWVEPILNRVGPMLSDARTRRVLTKTEGVVNLTEIIQNQQILIVKVAKGQLDQNANLLGSLLVTGVKQAAMAMAEKSGRSANRVAMYLDEFDNFIEVETVKSITGESHKYQIGLIGALKTLQDLPEDFRNQLIISVGTMLCSALAKKDGDLLGPQMFRVDGRKIKHQTIQNFFNQVNSSPQFEFVSDEEKLNIDRVVGQEHRTLFCYRVGTVAGIFKLKSHDFDTVPLDQFSRRIVEKMFATGAPECFK
jgi:hypothetical protein